MQLLFFNIKHQWTGSIPEREESTGKIFNTLTAYDPSGKMIAKHRKVHLFDIDIPGGITFKVKMR